jgi:hypothetical protein
MLTPNVAALAGFDRDQPGPDSTSPDGLTEVPSRWGLPECFAVAQVAGPAILFLPGSQAFRAPLRIGIFALSLSGLIWCFRHSRLTKTHPSWVILLLAAAYMTVMIFHPATNTGIAGMAQIGMHLAVILGAQLLPGRLPPAPTSAYNPLGLEWSEHRRRHSPGS